MRPRVLLADDHAMVAEGLAHLIGDVAELVGRVNDGLSLVEETRRLRPDVVVTDITMPGMSRIDAMRKLKLEGSGSHFIFLTVHAEPLLAAEAMRSGAAGYLLKHAAGDELREAIKAVMEGRIYLTPMITGDLLRVSLLKETPLRDLTSRQREVLRLLAEGKPMKGIAAELNISVRTVEDHKAHLKHVLGLKSTADLVRFAIQQRIIPG